MADASSSEDEEEIISFREAKRPKIDTDDAPPQPASALPTDELAAEIAKYEEAVALTASTAHAMDAQRAEDLPNLGVATTDDLPQVPLAPPDSVPAPPPAPPPPSSSAPATQPVDAQWAVGDVLDALDCRKVWCRAKVKAERGAGIGREIHVHYFGWKAKWDEWILSRSSRLRRCEAKPPPPPKAACRPKKDSSAGGGRGANAGDRAAGKAATASTLKILAACRTGAPVAASYSSSAKVPPSSGPSLLHDAARADAEADDCEAAAQELVARAQLLRSTAAELRARAAASAPDDAKGALGADDAASADARSSDSELALPTRQPSQLSDGELVRAERELYDDGDYERCGTMGCILANKHPGLHVFPPPQRREARGRDRGL